MSIEPRKTSYRQGDKELLQDDHQITNTSMKKGGKQIGGGTKSALKRNKFDRKSYVGVLRRLLPLSARKTGVCSRSEKEKK